MSWSSEVPVCQAGNGRSSLMLALYPVCWRSVPQTVKEALADATLRKLPLRYGLQRN